MRSIERGRGQRFDGQSRLAMIQYLLVAAFATLGFRLWSLQVIHHEEYVRAAESNRLKTIPIAAPRGLILDREGRVLVDNRPTLSIIVNREEVKARGKSVLDLVDELIAQGVTLDRDFVRARLEVARRQPLYYPMVIEANADPADVAWVRAHQLEYPELDVIEQPQRRYPYGRLLAHVLGYVGEISQRELARPEYEGYRPGDIIGKAGVEKVYDRLLRGRDGIRRVVVDSAGREISQIEQIDPIPGRSIRLTIDLDLQRVAEQQLGHRRGVVVAMDPRTGEILAMVSHPAFDPNLFAARINTPEGKAEFRRLVTDPDHPLYNRAIQGLYPTGSTWKVLVATAALEEGVISVEDSRLMCGGGLQVGRRFVRCMGAHGMPDLHRALVVSCDGYFYRLGLKLGIRRMHEWVKRLGMGQPTGIDLPNERGGIIPGPEVKARLNPKDPIWRDFDTVIAAIGQGSVAVTPLQLLRAVAGIAMGGILHRPHVFLEAGPPGQRLSYQGDDVVVVPLHQRTCEMIRYSLWGVVNEQGTGTRARVVGFDVSGKTGTAQVVATHKAGGKLKDHAWFVAFAPRSRPEIAVVVLVENVGFGGTYSAPIARAIFEAYRNKHYGAPEEVGVARQTPPSSTGPSSDGEPVSQTASSTSDRPAEPTETRPPSDRGEGERGDLIERAPDEPPGAIRSERRRIQPAPSSTRSSAAGSEAASASPPERQSADPAANQPRSTMRKRP